MNEAKRLFRAAQREGIRMHVYYPGESPDYFGTNAAEAWKAASACDLMHVSFHNVGGECVGWALIIPELQDDEVVADYAGWWIDTALGETL